MDRADQYQQLQDKIARWSNETFGPGEKRLLGMCNHLVMEAAELRNRPDGLSELADVLILLLNIARVNGYHVDLLFYAAAKKHQINVNRNWKLMPDETYQHVE